MRVVVESPLRGKTREETRENLRYLLWCCRAVYLAGYSPIASHLIYPWFMDDSDTKERADGIDWPWMWEPGVPHWFFTDCYLATVRPNPADGMMSDGMWKSRRRCDDLGVPWSERRLVSINPECVKRCQRGEWPPHTEGFEST